MVATIPLGGAVELFAGEGHLVPAGSELHIMQLATASRTRSVARWIASAEITAPLLRRHSCGGPMPEVVGRMGCVYCFTDSPVWRANSRAKWNGDRPAIPASAASDSSSSR